MAHLYFYFWDGVTLEWQEETETTTLRQLVPTLVFLKAEIFIQVEKSYNVPLFYSLKLFNRVKNIQH